MANDKQFKVNTKFVGTRGVKEYRESIAKWVNKDDVVLEIGCEWGTTTAFLAPQCKEVIGTDISPDCIARARQQHPEIRFEVLDAFDVLAAQNFGKHFTKVYIDMSGISGYRSLLDLISLLTMYATVLRPEAIIVKSGALKHFASHCIAWRSDQTQEQKTDTEDAEPPAAAPYSEPAARSPKGVSRSGALRAFGNKAASPTFGRLSAGFACCHPAEVGERRVGSANETDTQNSDLYRAAWSRSLSCLPRAGYPHSE